MLALELVVVFSQIAKHRKTHCSLSRSEAHGVMVALESIVFILIIEYHKAHCSLSRSEAQGVMLAFELSEII
jgi:hypothetical protein